MSPEGRKPEQVWVTVNDGQRVTHGGATWFQGDTFRMPAKHAAQLVREGVVREAKPG